MTAGALASEDGPMTQGRIVHDSFDGFVAALVEAGVRAVGIRAVNEIRPAPTPKGEGIVIGRQRWVDVTGYHAGVLYVLRLRDADPDPIEADLKARGFTVRSRSDNVT